MTLGRREEQTVAGTAKHYTNYTIYILLVTLGRREVRIIGGNSISLDDRRVYIYEDASQWAEMSGLAA